MLNSGCSQYDHIKFIENSTGIVFPPYPEILEVFDNQEFYLCAYMKYEKYAIDSLIAVVESKGCQEIDLIQSTWFYNLSRQPYLSD